MDSIQQGNRLLVISYGVDQQRIMSRLYAINGDTLDTLRTIIYVGDYEKEVVKDTLAGADRAIHRHFVEGGDGLAAIWVTGDSSSLNGMYYIHGIIWVL